MSDVKETREWAEREINRVREDKDREIAVLKRQVGELKEALTEHHSNGKCRCADFGFCKECKCWMSLNTGPNGECEKCGGIRRTAESER